jgi:hypothetical protein
MKKNLPKFNPGVTPHNMGQFYQEQLKPVGDRDHEVLGMSSFG